MLETKICASKCKTKELRQVNVGTIKQYLRIVIIKVIAITHLVKFNYMRLYSFYNAFNLFHYPSYEYRSH